MTGIKCVYGAGPVPGTLLNVNLDRPNAPPTIVSDAGQSVPLAMPYAVINIDAGHTEYVAVTPAGSGRFYEWSVKLTVVVDQHPRTYSFGSAAQPLRSWLGRPPPMPTTITPTPTHGSEPWGEPGKAAGLYQFGLPATVSP